MSFRENYASTIIPVNPSLTEFIHSLTALWVQRVPDEVCPSGVAVGIRVRMESTGDPCYFEWPNFLFDAQSGEFCARYESGNGLIFNLQTTQIYELGTSTYDNSNQTFGGTLVQQSDLSIYQLNQPTNNASGTYVATGSDLFPSVFSYWDGEATKSVFMWDKRNDIYLQSTTSVANGPEILSYVASTGARTSPFIRIPTCGVEQIAAMEPPFAMCFSRNNVITQFNYFNGQIMSVGKLPDFDSARGTIAGERLWAYDRYNHRILFCDQTDIDVDGNETIYIRGVDANPQGTAIIKPYTSKQPRVNRQVKIFTRVIGSAGEGINPALVNWTDQAVGDVIPAVQYTDRIGYAISSYDGLTTGGAETITVDTEVPEGYADSVDQGTGAGNSWVPNLNLDFNNVEINADVSNILTEQVGWDQVSGYGSFGDKAIKRPAKTSSAELRIQSGTSGVSGPTFGGDLKANLSTVDAVPRNGFLWVGAWVYFPTGFDFNTSSTGLRLFQIRDSFPTTGSPDADIIAELRLKHSAGSTHTGWALAWPNETVTDTRHDFAAHSSVLLSADTWHWVQYYVNLRSNGADASQRLWIDDLIVWELVGDQAQYRDSGGAGALTSFTANEAIATSSSYYSRADEVRLFRNWEGNAPSDQTCYVSNLVWTRDTTMALPLDENGNRYISKTLAENI